MPNVRVQLWAEDELDEENLERTCVNQLKNTYVKIKDALKNQDACEEQSIQGKLASNYYFLYHFC